MNNIIAIIPARYSSSRLPGKPLINISSKPMIQHVFNQAKKAFSHVLVATDDQRIYDVVKQFDGEAVMTSPNHKSGTDRCAEAVLAYEKITSMNFKFVINVQGDEPLIQPEQLQMLAGCIQKQGTQIATLVKKIDKQDILFDPNIPKVILNNKNEAIYFSRHPIPFMRNEKQENWLNKHTFYKHIGLYAYRKTILLEITKLPSSKIELAESLEQLRWIENGYTIKVEETLIDSISIDTKEDLQKL